MATHPDLHTYNELVADYLQGPPEEELSLFGGFAGNIGEAILHAGLARYPDGGTMPHMAHLDRLKLFEAMVKLNARRYDLLKCATFEDLFAIVHEVADSTWDDAPMYIYDTSFRIGITLRLYPLYVYMHRGTAVGAKALGLDGDRTYLEVSDFPPEFRVLEPYDIESLLCVYKDDLARIRAEEEGA
jgi:hypothetical protein